MTAIGWMAAPDARQVAQDFLDQQGAATIDGDVEATLGFCDIPCALESLEGRVTVTTEAEMRAICMTFIKDLRARQLTHMIRRCTEAMFKDDNTVWATYETRYILDGKVLSDPPYLGFVILRNREGRWKISAMQFAVSSDSPANATLRDWAQRQGVGAPQTPDCPSDRTGLDPGA